MGVWGPMVDQLLGDLACLNLKINRYPDPFQCLIKEYTLCVSFGKEIKPIGGYRGLLHKQVPLFVDTVFLCAEVVRNRILVTSLCCFCDMKSVNSLPLT